MWGHHREGPKIYNCSTGKITPTILHFIVTVFTQNKTQITGGGLYRSFTAVHRGPSTEQRGSQGVAPIACCAVTFILFVTKHCAQALPAVYLALHHHPFPCSLFILNFHIWSFCLIIIENYHQSENLEGTYPVSAMNNLQGQIAK